MYKETIIAGTALSVLLLGGCSKEAEAHPSAKTHSHDVTVAHVSTKPHTHGKEVADRKTGKK